MFRLFRSHPKQVLNCPKKKCAESKVDHCAKQCVKPCMTLRDIEVGKCVCIRNYKGSCKKMRRRLLDLGLTPQTEVNIVQKAPLGDPILLQVGESNLTLSLSEASHLEVETPGVTAPGANAQS